MFCTNCGSQFDDGNAFCPNCGTKVESVAQPVSEPAPVAVPVESAPVQAAPVEAAPVEAVPVAAAPVEAVPVAAAVEAQPLATPYEPAYNPAPAPAPAPAPVQVPVAPVQPVYGQAPVATNVVPISGAMAGDPELAKNIMVMGILAVAFACTYILAAAGIVFGAIGLAKSKKFIEANGQLFGKAKVGKFLSLGGLIASSAISAYVLVAIISGVIQNL